MNWNKLFAFAYAFASGLIFAVWVINHRDYQIYVAILSAGLAISRLDRL